MAYTIKLANQTMCGNMMVGVFLATGTGSNFTVVPNMRVANVVAYNVTTGNTIPTTDSAVSSGTYTFTPDNANDSYQVTFMGVPN